MTTIHATHQVSNRSATSQERALFGPRRTSAQGLPNPELIVKSLALSAVEIIEGVRPLDQISAWITGSVAAALSLRRTLNLQRRAVAGDARRIPHTFGRSMMTSPADGIVEATVTVHSRVKSRAVAVRLESIDHRWRATDLTVL